MVALKAVSDFLSSLPWRDIGGALSALLTPVIGITTAHIAYQQWQTNRDRFRVELYDRRANVLRATRKLLAMALQRGDLTMEQVEEFAAATAEASFVLDGKIAELIREIRNRAIQVSTRHDVMSRMQPGEELAAMRGRQGDDLQWMDAQDRALNARFGKYLTLP